MVNKTFAGAPYVERDVELKIRSYNNGKNAHLCNLLPPIPILTADIKNQWTGIIQ